VLLRPGLHDKARRLLIAAARAGADLDAGDAVIVRVVEYAVPGRAGDGKDELIALVTTITDPAEAPAQALAEGYHQQYLSDAKNPYGVLPGPRDGRVLPGRGRTAVAMEFTAVVVHPCQTWRFGPWGWVPSS
jgi:hypothetical protein